MAVDFVEMLDSIGPDSEKNRLVAEVVQNASDSSWMSANKNRFTDEFLDYLSALVESQTDKLKTLLQEILNTCRMERGLPTKIDLLAYLNYASSNPKQNELIVGFVKAFQQTDKEWVSKNLSKVTKDFLSYLESLLSMPAIVATPQIQRLLKGVLNECRHQKQAPSSPDDSSYAKLVFEMIQSAGDVEWLMQNFQRIDEGFIAYLKAMRSHPDSISDPERGRMFGDVLITAEKYFSMRQQGMFAALGHDDAVHETNREPASKGTKKPLIGKRKPSTPPKEPANSGPTYDLLLQVRALLSYEVPADDPLYRETTDKIDDDLMQLLNEYLDVCEYERDAENVSWFRRLISFCEPFADTNRQKLGR